MKLDFPHTFNLDDACARIRALTHYWDTRYGTSTRWEGSRACISGKVRGIRFEGTFFVDARRLVAEVKVGFLAEKIGGRAYVQRKLAQYLDPATPLESLPT